MGHYYVIKTSTTSSNDSHVFRMELKAEHIQITQLNYKIKNNFSKNACRKLYNPSFESLVSSQCILNSILGLETLYVVLLGHRGRLPSKINAKFKPFNTFNTHLSLSNSHNSALGLDRDLGFSRGPPPGSPR